MTESLQQGIKQKLISTKTSSHNTAQYLLGGRSEVQKVDTFSERSCWFSLLESDTFTGNTWHSRPRKIVSQPITSHIPVPLCVPKKKNKKGENWNATADQKAGVSGRCLSVLTRRAKLSLPTSALLLHGLTTLLSPSLPACLCVPSPSFSPCFSSLFLFFLNLTPYQGKPSPPACLSADFPEFSFLIKKQNKSGWRL